MQMPDYVASRFWLRSYPPGLPAEVAIPDVSIPELLERGMKKRPHHPAMVFADKQITHAEMRVLINHFAGLLSRWGVKKGDTVALLLPNCPHFACAYYAALKIGAMVTALSPLFMPPEIEFQLSDSNARTLVLEQSLWPKVESVLGSLNLENIVLVNLLAGKRAPLQVSGAHHFDDLFGASFVTPPAVTINPKDDVAILQYTGGTTGIPKAAMLTHFNVVADVTQMNCYLDLMERMTGVPAPTLVSVLPWYHIYGQTADLSIILCRGGTVVAMPSFDVERVLHAIQATKSQLFTGISSMYMAFLDHARLQDYDLSSLVWCNNGATVIPAETVRGFEQVTGVSIVEGYGLSEASPVTHTTSPYLKRKPGLVGPPIPNTLEAIIDPETREFLQPGQPGELVVHGPQVMKGYWQMPQETEDVFFEVDGKRWLRTGDLGVLDEDGYFRFAGRSKDLIKYKGHSVYSTEIEQVLSQHPAVSRAAVIGVPDRLAGEVIKAFIVLKDGFEAITEQEIISWARRRLAGYKHPRMIEFREQFPNSALSKMLRRLLRDEELKKQEVDEEVFA